MVHDINVSANKKSIRKEIDALKEEAKIFLDDKNTSNEIKLFIASILKMLDIIVMVLLEKQVRKNSGNSGIPPSKDIGSKNDRNDKNRKDKNRDKGERLDNTKTTQSEHTVTPTECSKCGCGLEDVEAKKVETRKEIDIFYEIHEKSVNSECKECPECGTQNKGKFPEGMDGPLQYGIGVKTAVINLLMVQMISMQRIREHLGGILGKRVSPAAMLRYVASVGMVLKIWEEQMKEELLKAPVIYVDETSIRINGKLFWIHTYSYGDIVLQFLHPSRGLEAIKDIGILESYDGIIVHDCWSSYFAIDNVIHALCLAHLFRELKFVEASGGGKWATRLKKLLKEAILKVRRRKSGKLTEKEYAQLQRQYRTILTQALMELPAFPEKMGKRGRVKHTTAQNLWLRLKEYESAVLLFARVKEVDPTNNRAERDLRMTKVKQKVSGCFRTQEMADHYCSITSYVKTMANKGYSAMEAIAMAIRGDIFDNSS